MTSYLDLNATLNLYDENGQIQFEKDKEAAREYFLRHVNQNTVFFHSLEEKADHLISEGLWDKKVVERYSFETFKRLFQEAYAFKFRFETFVGALKFYESYSLKTLDGKRYYERFEDRVVMTAIAYSSDELHAERLVHHIMEGRFQPATPTFLNAGRGEAGGPTSCYLLRIDDNLESITRAQTDASQLSKRGGGVALSLSNVREAGAPIKKYENKSSGVIPIMKILEDTFSYVDQLGQRQGAGAVYLNAHHPDIMRFLDTKRENADEKIRIKTLSLGVVIPDITFDLARENKDMYLFSPYDVEREYGQAFTDISVTEMYDEMVNNPKISKTKINARKFFTTLAELQFESGYPYIMFEDTVNYYNPAPNVGRISMSNLCVTGDTKILTDQGYRRADDLYETQEDFKVVVDERARTMDLTKKGTKIVKSSKMFKTAESARIWSVRTENNKIIRATEWHKFYVKRGGELLKLPLAELVPGDTLLTNTGKTSGFTKITFINYAGTADVYDPTVEDGHSVIYDGLVTGQCSEILQPQTPSEFDVAGEFVEPGRDIACNLGSLNVAMMMKADEEDFKSTVRDAHLFLTNVASWGDFRCSPSIDNGNEKARAIGLGQMNLHGYFIEKGVAYDSPEAVDIWRDYIAAVTFEVINSSCDMAEMLGEAFDGFEGSDWENGRTIGLMIDALIDDDDLDIGPNSLLDSMHTAWDWSELKERVGEVGLYNQHLQAIPPTGSISYINNSTASIHPIASRIEIRKEGTIGRVYYPAYGLTNENFSEVKTAYEMPQTAIIDMYAASTPFIDQGQSLTLFYRDTSTTRDINKAQIYAHKAGVKTIYYIRVQQAALAGTEMESCVSCML